ncbi:SHOCT domain-containing protein [Natronosalvus vescus]|uniref:SHOCT domain-containing protein n=1 Tax=Natronosalvus vescus TaxID=2953881 RepID=UPI002091410A|nr:SHOCT domain-containing protein [Natronosalvus vescus]
MSLRTRLAVLTPLIAVITLPVAMLAAIFAGPTNALAVVIVGWLLLTPASAILFGHPGDAFGTADLDEEIESVVRERVRERLDGQTTVDEGTETDPLATLRERYASGEIDDVELERRLHILLELDDADADDVASIERVKTTLEPDLET